MSETTFKSLFCRHFGCAEIDFEKALLWKSFFRGALPLAVTLRIFWPPFFRPDYLVLKRVGEITTHAQFQMYVDDMRTAYRSAGAYTPFRKMFNARVSGRRLSALGEMLWRPGRNPAGSGRMTNASV